MSEISKNVGDLLINDAYVSSFYTSGQIVAFHPSLVFPEIAGDLPDDLAAKLWGPAQLILPDNLTRYIRNH